MATTTAVTSNTVRTAQQSRDTRVAYSSRPTNVGKSGLSLETFYPSFIRDQEIKRFEDKVTTATNNLVAEQEKLEALADLKILSSNLKKSLDSLAMNGSNNDAYSHRQATINTSDAGNGSDYVNVTATNAASIGQTNVEVNQIATAAMFITHAATLSSQPNVSRAELKIDSGEPINILFAPNDDLEAMYNKIVNTGKNSGRFNAYISRDVSNPNSGQLVIKASQTGLVEDLRLEIFSTGGNGFSQVNNNILDNAAGSDAIIEVDSIIKTSSSNIFQDVVLGATIEAKKVNTAGADLTVNVKHSVEQLVGAVADFTIAFNELSEFVDIQSQFDKNNGGFVPSDQAKLYRTTSLKYAKEILLSATQLISGSSKNALSLKDIGIANVGSKDAIEINNNVASFNQQSFGRLDIIDKGKLLDICTNKPEILKDLFVGRVEVENLNGSTGILSLYNYDNDILISNRIIGKDINIQDDRNGARNSIQFSIDNGPLQTATFDGSNLLTFEGTDIEGLMMYYQPPAVGGVQTFKIQIAQGLARKDIIKIDHLNKQINIESESSKTQVNKLRNIETEASKRLNQEQDRIDKLIMELEFSLFDLDNFSQRLESMMESLN